MSRRTLVSALVVAAVSFGCAGGDQPLSPQVAVAAGVAAGAVANVSPTPVADVVPTPTPPATVVAVPVPSSQSPVDVAGGVTGPIDAGGVPELLGELELLAGEVFAGSWIDAAGAGHVAVTDASVTDALLARSSAAGADIEVHVVAYSWSRLVAEQRALEALWLADIGRSGATGLDNLTVFADAESNRVVVECVTRQAGDCATAARYAAASELAVALVVPGDEWS